MVDTTTLCVIRIPEALEFTPRRRTSGFATWVLATALLAPACHPEEAFMDNPHPEVVALLSWNSPTVSDWYTTSSTPPSGNQYQLKRVESFMFKPDLPSPYTDALELQGWWSPSRGDYLMTSDPAWASPTSSHGPDYAHVRLEGYGYAQPVSGSVPLRAFFSATNGDNYENTLPDWNPAVASPSGDYAFVRTEAWMPPPPESSNLPALQDLGLGNMKINGVTATGQRPLIMVRATYPSTTQPLNHDLAYYDALTFGPSYPNAVDYFREVSNGQFTWKRAGAYNVALGASVTSIETAYSDIVTQLAARGVDFSAFDTDGDGQVLPYELGVLMYDNGSINAAATRFGGCVDLTATQGVRVCGTGVEAGGVPTGGISAAGEETSFANVVHELTHQLGATDLYGLNCNSLHVTLMSCTFADGFIDERTYYHLDPWHEMQLGWIKPRLHSVLDPGSVERLIAPQVTTDGDFSDASPLLFYDPRRGHVEYLLVEYRAPSVTAATTYDAGNPAAGVVIWYVKQDATKLPATTPAVGDPMMRLEQTVFTLSAPSFTRGGQAAWSSANGVIAPTWLDGSDTGLRLQIGTPDPSGSVIVEWTSRTAPLVSRIDTASAASAAPGESVTLAGAFGLAQGPRTVVFRSSAGVRTALGVDQWQPYQLTLRVPPGVATGDGVLFVDADGSGATTSNRLAFSIR